MFSYDKDFRPMSFHGGQGCLEEVDLYIIESFYRVVFQALFKQKTEH